MAAIPYPMALAVYTDDSGAIPAALNMMADHLKPEHKDRTKSKVEEWFA